MKETFCFPCSYVYTRKVRIRSNGTVPPVLVQTEIRTQICPTLFFLGSPDGKESACNARDLGSVSGLGRFPGGGHGNHSSTRAWSIPMDRGAWWAPVHGVAESRT